MSRHENDKEKNTNQRRVTGYFPKDEYESVMGVFRFIAKTNEWPLTHVFRYAIREFLMTATGQEWVRRSLAQAPNAEQN